MFSIITISATDTTAIIDQAGTMVSDVMPLLIIFLGIGIGAYVIKVIINLRG